MALFDRFRLTLEDAEGRLSRPLTGDPSRGEKAVLAAINAKRFEDARRLLDRDASVGADAKTLFETHLRAQAARWETFKSWDISLPLPIWDEYARDSRLGHTSISRCLSAAIRRDYDRRMAALEPIDALRADIRAYHATQMQILEEARELVSRLGDIQNMSLQLRRIAMHLKVAS